MLGIIINTIELYTVLLVLQIVRNWSSLFHNFLIYSMQLPPTKQFRETYNLLYREELYKSGLLYKTLIIDE